MAINDWLTYSYSSELPEEYTSERVRDRLNEWRDRVLEINEWITDNYTAGYIRGDISNIYIDNNYISEVRPMNNPTGEIFGMKFTNYKKKLNLKLSDELFEL